MRKGTKLGLIGSLVVAAAASVYSFKGSEVSRSLVEHEVSKHIPVRKFDEQSKSYVHVDTRSDAIPPKEIRIPWAERKVYKVNRFLDKPVYEIVVDQDLGIEICDVGFVQGREYIACNMKTTAPDFDPVRHIASDPNEQRYEHLFNPDDEGYARLK